jgi:hypothetical protein
MMIIIMTTTTKMMITTTVIIITQELLSRNICGGAPPHNNLVVSANFGGRPMPPICPNETRFQIFWKLILDLNKLWKLSLLFKVFYVLNSVNAVK